LQRECVAGAALHPHISLAFRRREQHDGGLVTHHAAAFSKGLPVDDDCEARAVFLRKQALRACLHMHGRASHPRAVPWHQEVHTAALLSGSCVLGKQAPRHCEHGCSLQHRTPALAALTAARPGSTPALRGRVPSLSTSHSLELMASSATRVPCLRQRHRYRCLWVFPSLSSVSPNRMTATLCSTRGSFPAWHSSLFSLCLSLALVGTRALSAL